MQLSENVPPYGVVKVTLNHVYLHHTTMLLIIFLRQHALSYYIPHILYEVLRLSIYINLGESPKHSS